MAKPSIYELESGRVWLENNIIHYRSNTYGDWDLPLYEVRVIGEITNEDMPAYDDWFMAFTRVGNDGWYEASAYADHFKEFKKELAEALKTKIETELYYSTTFASRVIWPEDLRGKPMFEFRLVIASSLPGRFWRWLFPQSRRYLTPDVLLRTGVSHWSSTEFATNGKQ